MKITYNSVCFYRRTDCSIAFWYVASQIRLGHLQHTIFEWRTSQTTNKTMRIIRLLS
ncbi:uncharacterized protein METZ01_LOCUS483276 [marine metagenome]|uniref:Uncharacterized protein n=1 Tax=marine metagenome TaxID=408172 RepID=A0A383CDZ0_9ZZZZ